MFFSSCVLNRFSSIFPGHNRNRFPVQNHVPRRQNSKFVWFYRLHLFSSVSGSSGHNKISPATVFVFFFLGHSSVHVVFNGHAGSRTSWTVCPVFLPSPPPQHTCSLSSNPSFLLFISVLILNTSLAQGRRVCDKCRVIICLPPSLAPQAQTALASPPLSSLLSFPIRLPSVFSVCHRSLPHL